MKILLVEDTIGDPIQRVLTKSGHEVELAQSGEAARRLLEIGTFDFCLVDWMLPDISGLDIVDLIRRDDRNRGAAILMISSRSGRADIVTAFRSGIDGYVAKPFNAAQLRTKIDEVWQRRSRNRAHAQQIHMIFESQEDLRYWAMNPLIIFAESISREEQLAKIWNAPILDYLTAATTAVAAANAFMPTFKLGYTIATSTGEVTKLLKERETRDRVQMAFVSADCQGNCVLMAKLIHMRSAEKCPICIVCNQPADLTSEQRVELRGYGALVMDRREMDGDRWRDLIEGIIKRWESAGEEPSSDETEEDSGRGFRRAAKFWLEAEDTDESNPG